MKKRKYVQHEGMYRAGFADGARGYSSGCWDLDYAAGNRDARKHLAKMLALEVEDARATA